MMVCDHHDLGFMCCCDEKKIYISNLPKTTGDFLSPKTVKFSDHQPDDSHMIFFIDTYINTAGKTVGRHLHPLGPVICLQSSLTLPQSEFVLIIETL